MGNERKELKWFGAALLALGLFWLFRAVLLGTGFFFGDFANQDLPKLFFNAGELLQGRFPAWCPYNLPILDLCTLHKSESAHNIVHNITIDRKSVV